MNNKKNGNVERTKLAMLPILVELIFAALCEILHTQYFFHERTFVMFCCKVSSKHSDTVKLYYLNVVCN